ncbi:hypothetical protein [Thalassospira marina]|uniref:Uncharacterized protein n=1 Tax=Thalassospira marina TaxID=2048283 RepID=A0A2N3KXV7_9PROT|nr:hypothetical protein [Thalassospira marina]PKR55421.1 hypothetical protein COO20_04420 [Thalassospira marina]
MTITKAKLEDLLQRVADLSVDLSFESADESGGVGHVESNFDLQRDDRDLWGEIDRMLYRLRRGDDVGEDVAALRAENERLRGALENLSDKCAAGGFYSDDDADWALVRDARSALKGGAE